MRLNTPSLPNSVMYEDFTVKLLEGVGLVPWRECDIHQQQYKRSEKKLISSTADVKQWSSEGVNSYSRRIRGEFGGCGKVRHYTGSGWECTMTDD